jgi:signal transduction histidine kinase
MQDKANILLVDDEMGPRESLRIILKPYYNVFAAERGGQAIEIMEQIPIDLVTVDLRMPGLSGVKVLERVKQHDPDIEAIIITGYGSMDTAIEGLRLGAFDYIAKPFDVQHVLDLIRRALERRAAKLKLKQFRTDFLANVSHELRTPLSVVLGFVSLLMDQFVGKLTDEQLSILERVYKNSEELLGLIDNMLCLSSVNTGELPQSEEELDLGQIVDEAARSFHAVLSDKGICLSVEIKPGAIRMVSDPDKIKRIVQNLLSNAIKFTPRGEITIKAHRSLHTKSVQLEIIDTGIGIHRDRIELIFQPFCELDSSSQRQFPGLRLGLTLARKLTDLLEGSLEIRSQPGVGTHVIVNLPDRSERHKKAPARISTGG